MSEGTKVTIYAAPKVLQDMIESLYDTVAAGGSELEPVSGGNDIDHPTVIELGPPDQIKWAKASPGWYDFGNGPEEAQEFKTWIVWWDKIIWSLKDMGALPMQDLSDYLSVDGLGKTLAGSNEFNPALVQDDKVIASNGNIGTGSNYIGFKTVIGQPVISGQRYVLSGHLANAAKYIAFRDATGAVTSIQNFSTNPRVVVASGAAVTVDYTIKTATESGDQLGTFMWEKESSRSPSPYEPYTEAINAVEGNVLEADKLSKNNAVPDPTNPKNALNLAYFNLNTVRMVDLTLKLPSNLARMSIGETVILNKYILDNGGINQSAAAQGWAMYAFYPLRNGLNPGDQFVVHRFTISGGGYAAWYQGISMLTNVGRILTPHVYTVPATANTDTVLYIDIKRPADSGTNYSNLTINAGITPLAYVDPTVMITHIRGYSLQAEENAVSSFKDLTDVPPYLGNENKALKINPAGTGIVTFDPVEQGTDINANTITAQAVVVENVPEWDETGIAPVSVGQEYLKADGTGNFFRKVRGL